MIKQVLWYIAFCACAVIMTICTQQGFHAHEVSEWVWWAILGIAVLGPITALITAYQVAFTAGKLSAWRKMKDPEYIEGLWKFVLELKTDAKPYMVVTFQEEEARDRFVEMVDRYSQPLTDESVEEIDAELAKAAAAEAESNTDSDSDCMTPGMNYWEVGSQFWVCCDGQLTHLEVRKQATYENCRERCIGGCAAMDCEQSGNADAEIIKLWMGPCSALCREDNADVLFCPRMTAGGHLDSMLLQPTFGGLDSGHLATEDGRYRFEAGDTIPWIGERSITSVEVSLDEFGEYLFTPRYEASKHFFLWPLDKDPNATELEPMSYDMNEIVNLLG